MSNLQQNKMLHPSNGPYCVATLLLQCNLHHHSNNLQLSKGLPIPGLLSDILEQIRIGSNVSQYHLKFTITFYVHTYVKGNIEWNSEQACQEKKQSIKPLSKRYLLGTNITFRSSLISLSVSPTDALPGVKPHWFPSLGLGSRLHTNYCIMIISHFKFHPWETVKK